MKTISFQVPEEMAEKLEFFARELDRSKAWLIRDSLSEYLEDLADYVEARRIQMTTKPEDYIPWEQVRRELGLDHEEMDNHHGSPCLEAAEEARPYHAETD